MSELGLGTCSKNSMHGHTLNPQDLEKTAGGSSGASAAIIASGIVPFSLATDTTGGIRIPSACNGVVGYRPTLHRWPNDYGFKLT